MMEYRKILEFEYKKIKYHMFLDKNNRKFFMKKVKNGELKYVTNEEFSELTIFFTSVPKIMRIVKDNKEDLLPKVISGGITVALSLSVLRFGLSRIGFKFDNLYPSQTTSEVIESEDDLKNYVSLNTNDDKTSNIDLFEYKNNKTRLEIYDMDYLDMVFETDVIDINTISDIINGNDFIPDNFKPLLLEYSEKLISKYPDIDLRVFYNNLKDLRVQVCDKDEIIRRTGITNSFGFYSRDVNEIYILDDIDYYNNEWAHQVIYHELSHCLRVGKYYMDDLTVKVFPEGPSFNNEITSEALNSLFAVSLFDYEEDVIAYQLQSNYYKIMLECMDNYNLSDYINHSLSYFTSKLDEYNNDENYAPVILELIQTQFQDYHSDSIEVEQSEYYPIYDYICNMYYGKYITGGMNYDEMRMIADNLIEKVTLYAPDEYDIDTSRFYDNLDNYYRNTFQNNFKKR